MVGAEVAERLKGMARSAFPQSTNNSSAMNEWVRRILDFMRKVEPAEYAEVHAAVFSEQSSALPGEDVVARLSVLYRKLDEEGQHVGANTVSLAIDEIKGRVGQSDNTRLAEALSAIEQRWPGSFWHMAKGRTRADEPMFGFQVLFGTDEILAEGEGDSEVAAIRASLASQGAGE